MSKAQALIEAMRAHLSDERYASAEGWLEQACVSEALRVAMLGVFGKYMPTPQKLGQWLCDHQGKRFGPELVLQGRHSPKRKGWIWRAIPFERLVPPPVTVQPTPAPPPPPAAVPEKPVYRREPPRIVDGQMREGGLMIDPRSGEPILERPVAPEVPAAAPAEVALPEEAPASHDARPPWVIRGELTARDKAEWLAWQKQRMNPAGSGIWRDRNAAGYDDPGGIVSSNMNRDGIGPGEISTLWNRKLSDL